MQQVTPAQPPAVALTKWGARHKVFAILALVNLTIWLDEGIFGSLTPYWSKSLHLSPAQIGTGSAAYLLGYFPLLLVAGILSDRFGARKLLLLSIAGCSLMSAAMLLVSSYETLFLRNIIFGIFFGFLWAPSNRMMAIWLPGHERARYAAIWMSTTLFSFVIGAPLGLLIAAHASWPVAFLVVTILGIPGFLLLLLMTTERPEQLKSMTPAELHYIYGGRVVEKELAAVEFHWRDMGAALRQWSVLWMVIATALATTPTWLILTWGPYGLINEFKVSAGTASSLIDAGIMVVVIYGFFNGWVVTKVFGGRCRPALAAGAVISGLGFLAVAAFTPNYVAWAFLIFALGFMVDPFFWGTINAYWAGLAKPEYSGTLNGLSAALQVAVGYVLLSLSGTWVNTNVTGPAALKNIWLIGGIIFMLAAIPVYLAREVYVGQPREELPGMVTARPQS